MKTDITQKIKRLFIWIKWNSITTELVLEGKKKEDLMPFEEYYQTKVNENKNNLVS